MTDFPPPGLLLDHTQDKVVVLDAEGRYTYANDAVRRILGFAPADLVGEYAFDYVHPDDVESVRAAFERTIASAEDTQVTAQYRHRAEDGSWVELESRMANVTHEELDGYVVSSRDVSERVRMERDHAELASRLEELAETTDDVLWMFDSAWSDLLFVNPAFEAIYGMPTRELRADPLKFLQTVHPDDRPLVEAAMSRLSDGESMDLEYRVNPDEDFSRWVWVRASPVFVDGDVVRITGFTRDISDRRRRERQLYVMDNLLRHNLRNDLNVIVGTADLVAERAPAEAERLERIRRTSEQLLESAEKERDIIAVLTDEHPREVLDLVDVVERSVGTLRERFPGAVVETTLPDEAPVLALRELGLVVTELFENAVRHCADDSPAIRLAVRNPGDAVELVFEDGGPPIPAIEADVLRGNHDATDVTHSSGLGFWLVYWTVELSGGDIAVERTADGNRITLTLPRRPT